MANKAKIMEKFINDIPNSLDEFKQFLNESGLNIDNFSFNEMEINQIEPIMRKYFKGREREFLDIDNYRPLFKAPVYKIEDSRLKTFSIYLGEYIRQTTNADWTFHTGNTISSGKFAIVFKNEKFEKTIVDFVPDFIIDNILRGRMNDTIITYLNFYINETK